MLGLIVGISVISAPGQTSGFAPFVEPVGEASGLTRQQLANLYLVATLISAGLIVLAGNGMDRIGCRRAQAVRFFMFWIILINNGLLALVATAISFHIVPLGEARNLSTEKSLSFFIPMTWTSMCLGLGANLVADKLSFRPFFLIQVTALSLGMGLLGWTDHFTLAAVAFGIALAMSGPITVMTIPRWFGRKHLGAIGSVNWSAVVVGSALGPMLVGFALENHMGLLAGLSVGLAAVLLVCSLLFAVPQLKAAAEE